MREFNKRYITNKIVYNYYKVFPNKNIIPTTLVYGFKNDKTEKITNMFFCFDSDHELIGFAVHFSSNILRLYNHEGENIGLEINMKFIPPKKK